MDPARASRVSPCIPTPMGIFPRRFLPKPLNLRAKWLVRLVAHEVDALELAELALEPQIGDEQPNCRKR